MALFMGSLYLALLNRISIMLWQNQGCQKMPLDFDGPVSEDKDAGSVLQNAFKNAPFPLSASEDVFHFFDGESSYASSV